MPLPGLYQKMSPMSPENAATEIAYFFAGYEIVD